MAHPLRLCTAGFVIICGCTDASGIRRTGVIAAEPEQENASEEALPPSHLERCLHETSLGTAKAIRAHAVVPEFDIEEWKISGAFAVFFTGGPSKLRRQFGTREVAWLYGRLALMDPNDPTLVALNKLTVQNAKLPVKQRDVPVTEWRRNPSEEWVSNSFALRLIRRDEPNFRLAGLDETSVLERAPGTYSTPMRLEEIHEHGAEISVPKVPLLLRPTLYATKGRFTFRVTAIEFIGPKNERICIPVA